jgi:sortase (surface protein transpeptidase)
VTEPHVAGWYAEGVTPGDVGPALVAGHVSGRPDGATTSVPGVFARLGTLREGDRVTVDRDGTPATFEVYRIAAFAKDAFPTGDVYANTDGPELRLVTCGGELDRAAHSYRDNLIVFARLAS